MSKENFKATFKRKLKRQRFKFYSSIFFDGAAQRVESMVIIRTLGFATALGFILLCAHVLWDSRQDAAEQSRDTDANLALAISQDIKRNFEFYDLSLQGVTEVLALPELKQLSPVLRARTLFDHASMATYLNRIVVMDTSGNVTEDSRPAEPLQGNFADREYFRVHMGAEDPGLFVSKPFLSKRSSGGWVMALSRRISNPDGSFGGVVVGTLSLDYFHALFINLKTVPLGIYSVARSDGTMIMRYPFRLRAIGMDLSRSKLFEHFPAERSGTYEADSGVDATRRVYSYTQVGNLPLVVVVGSAKETIFAAWRRKTWMVGSLMAALGIAMVTLSAILVRELRRRRVTEKELAATAAALAKAAATDELTGLPNRRCFDETAEREWKRAIRDGSPISVLVADVDLFKAYNDTYGHLSGDKALQVVASCIQATIKRPADFGARFGGEEFALLLPSTDAQGAVKVAEALRAAVAASKSAYPGDLDRDISVSVGATSVWPQRGDEFERTFVVADRALFRAKELGRNRVEYSEPAPVPPPKTSLPVPSLPVPSLPDVDPPDADPVKTTARQV
jgi:diguanylate cyclase (GGDEF)-like protein